MRTYSRAVYRQYTGARPPSKSKAAHGYRQAVLQVMVREGVYCPTVSLPGVDHCDAILCALAARAFVLGRAERLGAPPLVD